MSIKIALAGNPNCGKTTLFNALTGSNQFVGNWPGVTVEKKEGKLKKQYGGNGDDVIIMDLPGIYSLSPYTLEEVVAQAGSTTVKDPVYFVGGPMMGRIGNGSDPVTKTTNAILVLPKDHLIVAKKQRTSSIDLKRAASICCQCNTCTDLCPRHNLGHPIDPARFMRAASAGDFRDVNPYIDSAFCSSCGVCEMYSCPQSLAPRSLLADMKGGLRKAGIRPPQGVQPKPVQESREYRKVPEERLMARLGLTKYDKDAPMDENVVPVSKVKILLSQHIGAPAQAIVKTGDMVTKGQMIAQHADGLSVSIHASISGKVTEVTDRHIIIAAK